MSDREKDLKDGLDKLEDMQIEELTDEDLESVAGGAESCSTWCCSDGSSEGGGTELDYPLNLSILLSGGRETNWDSLSNGE